MSCWLRFRAGFDSCDFVLAAIPAIDSHCFVLLCKVIFRVWTAVGASGSVLDVKEQLGARKLRGLDVSGSVWESVLAVMARLGAQRAGFFAKFVSPPSVGIKVCRKMSFPHGRCRK